MAPPQSRSKLYSIGAISLAVGLGLFLLLSPAVEREAYLAQIRDPDSTEWNTAMLHLCWIEPGRAGLDASLPELERAHRLAVLEEARSVGCLHLLKPELAAEYWVWHPEMPKATQSAIGYGDSAVEPALVGLESDREDVRAHARRIVSALEHELSEEESERFEEARLDSVESPPGEMVDDLEIAPLEVSDPAPERDAGSSSDATVTEVAPSDLPELDLKLEEPMLKARSPGVLFAAEPEEPDAADRERVAAPDGQDVELAPPPARPESDGGGERVEQ